MKYSDVKDLLQSSETKNQYEKIIDVLREENLVLKNRLAQERTRCQELHANGERLKEAADGWKVQAQHEIDQRNALQAMQARGVDEIIRLERELEQERRAREEACYELYARYRRAQETSTAWRVESERLEALLKQAKAKCGALRLLIEEVMRSHQDPDSGRYNECDTDPCQWCINAKAALAEKESK